jgi:hypothetical protein
MGLRNSLCVSGEGEKGFAGLCAFMAGCRVPGAGWTEHGLFRSREQDSERSLSADNDLPDRPPCFDVAVRFPDSLGIEP